MYIVGNLDPLIEKQMQFKVIKMFSPPTSLLLTCMMTWHLMSDFHRYHISVLLLLLWSSVKRAADEASSEAKKPRIEVISYHLCSVVC